MGNVTNFADQKKTGNSYLEAIRKADGFLDRNSERIPGSLHAAGIREILIHFAAKETARLVVELALPDEAVPRARSEFELITTLLAELPPIEFADDDGTQLHLAAEAEITSAWTGRGERIDYATAIRLAAEKQEAAIRPPDVDPESESLDLAAQAEIEAAWKSRGERISYLDALRIAETTRSNR